MAPRRIIFQAAWLKSLDLISNRISEVYKKNSRLIEDLGPEIFNLKS
jgi:hypothetical protein